MNFKINSFLFLLFFIYANCEKTCIYSGSCGTGEAGFPIPCVRESEPQPLKESKSLDFLKKMCPEFYSKLKDDSVCCDDGQMRDFVKNMELMNGFEKCPSCINNFRQIFCELTCSPNQKNFMKVTKKSIFDEKKDLYKVDAITYGVNFNQTNIFYDSCENAVSSELNNLKFLDLFGTAKNGLSLFKNVGKRSSFIVDFYFHKTKDEVFILDDNDKLVPIKTDLEYVDFDFKNCDELSRNKKCLCTQCKKLKCPLVPELEDPKNCQIFIFECSTFIIALIYSFLFILSIVFSSKFFKDSKREGREDTSISDMCLDDKENFQNKLERRFGIFFENWTRICVRNPYYVIFIGFVIVIILSTGLNKLKVISDPVELWSSKKSESRQQREFYNENFGPFYRIQQVIIRKTDSESSVVPSKSQDFSGLFDYEFLSASFDLFDKIINLKGHHSDKDVSLNDVCYQPLNEGKCLIQSPFAWFQENINNFKNETYLSTISNCLSNFQSELSCFGSYGGPVFPYVVLGGYDGQNYNDSQSVLINILINNHLDPEKNSMAMAWEKKFIDFMAEYEKNLNQSLKMDISYYSERSVEDELERQSLSEIGTVAISYFIMFIYVAISLRPLKSKNRFFIDSRIGLAIVGVLIVLASVSSSIGFLSFCGFEVTLIIVEVIPFLVLAVGVDNIFIIVQSLDSEKSLEGENLEDHISRVMSKVGPSLLLAFSSEVTCFFLGTLSSMPCIRIFALNAALALIIDFIMQITVFLAVLSLDCKRKKEDRFDILICIQSKKTNDSLEEKPTLLFRFFNNIYSPFLMKNSVRATVLIVFSLFFCISLCNVKKIDVGLDQELSMPKDSYVYKTFLTQKTQLRVGPPIYFVVKNSVDLSVLEKRNFITENNDNSLVFLANIKSKQDKTYIASQVASWVDNYDAWIANPGCFQVFKNNITFCSKSVEDREKNCERNDKLMEDTNSNIIRPEYYYNYVQDFLNDPPNVECPFGGKAQFKDSVKIEKTNNQIHVITFNLMAYHSVLKNSKDFVLALEDAKLTSSFIQTQINDNIGKPDHLEIFPYSIFYVYYEQFLTMWKDTIFSLSLSVFSIFLVSLIFLGFDLRNVIITIFTIISILLNVMNVMYWWNISLNAISLVNLVMSVGISVEFCSHILHYFSTHGHQLLKKRAQNAIGQMGISIYTGITLTKFVGIIVLANSKSQIFQIFYFRMYLTIVLVGSSHGLILLPVLLSIFGKK